MSKSAIYPKKKKIEPKTVDKQKQKQASATRELSRKDFPSRASKSHSSQTSHPQKAMSRQCRATEDKTRAGICDVTPHPKGSSSGFSLWKGWRYGA
jgi:hypothetical protein